MNNAEFARSIATQYQTQNPRLLAQRAGVSVSYGYWEPVTYGEFDRRRRTITINLLAPVSPTKILAHELGHFFAEQAFPGMERVQHEAVAKAFEELFGDFPESDEA